MTSALAEVFFILTTTPAMRIHREHRAIDRRSGACQGERKVAL
jgi:hypothetical protein